MERTAKRVKVTQASTPLPQIEPQVLAGAIIAISDGLRALLASGLNRRAVEVLIHDKSKVARRDIVLVLDAIGSLKRDYC